MILRISAILFLLVFSPFIQAKITVSVDREPIIANESFQLIFESDEKVKGEPDFSPLNKDFTILNTGRRSNTQIINGDFKQSHQWILSVIANKTGVIDIPAIKFGNVTTQPTKINVVASAPPTAGNKSDDIFIDVEVNKKSPYVQEQIIYTIKLYRAVQTVNATLTEPEISGDQVVITKLGEDKSFDTQIKGKRYVVVQRQYAIFPQSSGVLKVEPIVFQAQTGSAGFFGFDPFGPQPKSIVKRSDSIVLDVQAIPDSFTGDTWLPASQLNIQEQWSIDPAKLKQGEATTRTLTITANGLASSHLPAVESPLPDFLKQYPDQPELDENYGDNGFVGVRREKMAVIPTQSGEFTLPAIKIPWWNTNTDQMEMAELPERKINVNSAGLIVNDNVQQTLTEKDRKTTTKNVQKDAVQFLNTDVAANEQAYWKWISTVLFLMWIITLFLLWKSKNKVEKTVINTSTDSSIRQSVKQIKNACNKNDAYETKQALVEWARGMWPHAEINSINSIKEYSDDQLQTKLDELNTYLYSKQKQTWNGEAFLKCFESQEFKKKNNVIEKGKLEPLYKT